MAFRPAPLPRHPSAHPSWHGSLDPPAGDAHNSLTAPLGFRLRAASPSPVPPRLPLPLPHRPAARRVARFRLPSTHVTAMFRPPSHPTRDACLLLSATAAGGHVVMSRTHSIQRQRPAGLPIPPQQLLHHARHWQPHHSSISTSQAPLTFTLMPLSPLPCPRPAYSAIRDRTTPGPLGTRFVISSWVAPSREVCCDEHATLRIESCALRAP